MELGREAGPLGPQGPGTCSWRGHRPSSSRRSTSLARCRSGLQRREAQEADRSGREEAVCQALPARMRMQQQRRGDWMPGSTRICGFLMGIQRRNACSERGKAHGKRTRQGREAGNHLALAGGTCCQRGLPTCSTAEQQSQSPGSETCSAHVCSRAAGQRSLPWGWPLPTQPPGLADRSGASSQVSRHCRSI